MTHPAMNNPGRGRFVTLEGGEGAGKSTQIRHLLHRLAQAGLTALATREPGGSPRAEDIRALILAPQPDRLAPLAETLLFAAARADHLAATIRPALARGQWVVCDRFSDSTRAYQGGRGGVDEQILDTLDSMVVSDTRPDLTIILDLPASIGLARAAARRGSAETDRFESEALAFHEGLRTDFLAIAAKHPARCVVVDATLSEEGVSHAIWSAVTARLLNHGAA